MKKIILLPLLFLFSCIVTATADEIVVIGNIGNELNSLTKREVIAIFMGRTRLFPNGVRARPLDESELRDEFYEGLTSRSIKQIDAYWARLTFSGNSSPPPIKHGQQDIISEVKKSKGKIAYIKASQLDETGVKVLYRIPL